MVRLYLPLIILMGVFSCQFVVTGCTWLTRPISDDPLATHLVEQLQKNNESLERYKALANIRLGFQQEVQTVSMALAAAVPDRMRVELLSVVGQPLTSMVADGQTIRIRPYGEERIYKLRQSSTALERLIHLPIGVEQLQGALVGRPKLPAYQFAQLGDQQDAGRVVVLQTRWQKKARLEFDTANSKIQIMEVYDEEGDPLYRIHWVQWRHIGQYHLPSKLRFESNDGYVMTIRMKRFWPDAELSATTFELDPPAQGQ